MKKYSLTDGHRAQLKPWADKWIANAMSTAQMSEGEREICREAIKGLYRAAKLKPPPDHRIVFVPSPFVLRFATGFAAWVWHTRKCRSAAVSAATRDAIAEADAVVSAATRNATSAAIAEADAAVAAAAVSAATRNATAAAVAAVAVATVSAAVSAGTYAATDAATRDAIAEADAAVAAATRNATSAAVAAVDAATSDAVDATDDAVVSATRDAIAWYRLDVSRLAVLSADFGGIPALECAKKAYGMWQGGNQWSAWVSYLTFFRHVAKLPIDYSKWHHYEQLAIHSGPRCLHNEFAIISDRPELLTVDESHRPHNATGPFCQWRDGSALYSWHGVYVPWRWIEERETLDARTALIWPNIEQRRAAAEIIGWSKVISELKPRVIDRDVDPLVGELLEVDLPDSPGERFLRVLCGTGREFVLPVPREYKTALSANAGTFEDVDMDIIRNLEVRT